jgi:hypothetical protein
MQRDAHAGLVTFGAVRLALRGWQQRVHAVMDIARDSDDLTVRLPVLDQLAHELVADLVRAMRGLDAAVHAPGSEWPAGADLLREALGRAHAQLDGIELWHRAPSVSALRKARDGFRLAADRLEIP